MSRLALSSVDFVVFPVSIGFAVIGGCSIVNLFLLLLFVLNYLLCSVEDHRYHVSYFFDCDFCRM